LIGRLKTLAAFRANTVGGVVTWFVFAMVPLVMGIGLVIDYTQAARLRVKLQSAVDGASLIAGKNSLAKTDAQLKDDADAFVKGVMGTTLASVDTLTVNPQRTTVTITAHAEYDTLLVGTNMVSVLRKIGNNNTQATDKVTLSVSSQASWGNSRVRVALALDNTGSMSSSNKMTALKNASHRLLSQLQSSIINTGDVYVSIIPFSKDVNVGATNYNANWLRWDLWEDTNGSCSHSTRWQPNNTKTQCQGNGWTWTPNNHNTWTGCVTDRDQNYDTNATAPVAGTQATLFPAEQFSGCPVQMMALTYDFAALNAKIDAMTPTGNTNQTIGLQWALQSLVANSPLAVPAKSPDYQYKEAIILMTDGLNTQNRFSSSQNQIDSRTSLACMNAKNAGILLFTVQVNTDGDPTSTMLRDCATDISKFFMLTDPNQLVATFDQIAVELSALRLAK
jgi:Flp pilus assembly protein TadG